MPKPLSVDWPAVRVLAVAVGVREAARQMGISQDAVRQRSKRERWMTSVEASAQRALSKPVTRLSPDVLSPADALGNVLNERKHRTKLGLSKYAAEAAERAGESDGDLALSRNVRDVAAIGSTLWPEDHNEPGILTVAYLTGEKQPERIEKRVEALEVESSHESIAAKTEKKREVTWERRDRAPALDPVPQPTPVEIAAQEKRQKEAEYREKCRHWRQYT